MAELNYHMAAVYGNGIFNYHLLEMERPEYKNGYLKDDVLIKAFAKQQDQYLDLDDTWFIQVWFKDMNDDGPNDNQGHIFPSAIPLFEVLGKRQGDIIEFFLDEDTSIRVTCDQSIIPGFSPEKWGDEDPAYAQDPFVSEWSNAMYRRLYEPYNIDYNVINAERIEKRKQTHEYLNKLFADLKK